MDDDWGSAVAAVDGLPGAKPPAKAKSKSKASAKSTAKPRKAPSGKRGVLKTTAKIRAASSPARSPTAARSTSMASSSTVPSLQVQRWPAPTAPRQRIPFEGPIRVGSVCSGMLTEHWSLSALPFSFSEQFWCEKDPIAKKFLSSNVPGVKGYDDLMGPDFQQRAPGCDLLVGGFPCQPFSAMGKGEGADDSKGRGTIVCGIIAYARKHLPRIILLENVQGLVTRHPEMLLFVLRQIEQIKENGVQAYSISWKVLNSLECGGVPHRRMRLYIMAIRRMGRPKVVIKWPEPIPAQSLAAIFDREGPNTEKLTSYDEYPMPDKRLAQKNLEKAIEKVKAVAARDGQDATSYPIIVDTQSTDLNMGWGVCPCLTKARGGALAFWSLQHARPLSARELCRLQGLKPSSLVISITPNQLGALLGNGFTCTLMSRLIQAAINASEAG